MFNRTRLAIAAAASLALAATAAVAAPTAEPAAATPAPAAAPTSEAVVTGALPADHDHPIALRDDAALLVVTNPDGSQTALLDDSFLSTSVARIDADGKVVIGCVHTREEYDAFFAAEAQPAGAEVR